MSEEVKQHIHKKIVHLKFADVEVKLETEDGYDISDLNNLAFSSLSVLIKDRIACADILDGVEGDSGGIPEDKPKQIIAEPKTQIQAMYQ